MKDWRTQWATECQSLTYSITLKTVLNNVQPVKGFLYESVQISLERVQGAIPYLRRGLSAPGQSERLRAANMLAWLGEKGMEKQFMKWLSDPVWQNKPAVMSALAKMALPGFDCFFQV